MHRSLLLVCVLMFLQSIKAIDNKAINNKTSVSQSSIADDNEQAKQSIPINKSEQSLEKKKDLCLASFRKVFEFEICVKLGKQLDEIRCKLMNETAHDFCSSSNASNVEDHTTLVPDLCERNFELNTSRVIPSTVAFLLDGWKTLEHFGCQDVCTKKEKEYFKVCLFVFSYYTDLLSFTKSKQNSISNEGRSENSVHAVPSSVEDNLPGNLENVRKDNVDEGNDDIAGDDVDVKQENEQNKVDEPEPIAKKPVVLRENLANIDDPKSQHISETNGDNIPLPKIDNDGDSHALSYFALVSGICIVLYLMMYNKKKILALMIEGRRRNVKRRPNGAAYSKLDSNLEEALASGPSTSTSNTLLY